MSSDEKTCPHCAETVKTAALKCKHCGSELPSPPHTPVEEAPEKKKASCAQMLGCFGVLMVVGLISAIFNAGASEDNNNIAEADAGQVSQPREQTALREKPPLKSEPARVNAIRQPEIRTTAVASPSADLRKLCYVGVNTNLPVGVTVGEFLDRGKQRGYFRNALITGGNGSYTLRFRVPSNNDLKIKIITLNFRRGDVTPGCTASHSAVLNGGKINFEALNDANLYVLVAMLEAMAFSDDVEPLN